MERIAEGLTGTNRLCHEAVTSVKALQILELSLLTPEIQRAACSTAFEQAVQKWNRDCMRS